MLILLLVAVKFFYFYNRVRIQKNYFYTVALSTVSLAFIMALGYKLSLISGERWYLLPYGFVSAVMLIDLLYYAHFNELTTINLLKQIRHLTTVGDSLGELWDWKMLLMVWDVPILPFLPKRVLEILFSGLSVKVVGLFGLLIVLALLYFQKARQVLHQELIAYHGFDIVDSMVEPLRIRTLRESVELTSEAIDRHRLCFPSEGRYHGVLSGKNLIFLQVEALQNIVLNRRYAGREITPNLNALARECAQFDRFFQSIGRGNTSDAEFAALTSLYPASKCPTFMEYADRHYEALPGVLAGMGYRTAAFHGNTSCYYNRQRMYRSLGFTDCFERHHYRFRQDQVIGFGIADAFFYRQTVDKMLSLEKHGPFFGFVISLSSHTPFHMPPAYADFPLRPEDEGTMLGRYLVAIHYADAAIGIFVQRLRETGLWDRSGLVLYGDHFGLSASDDGMIRHASEVFELPHGYGYDHMMNVPLLIHAPGIRPEVLHVTGSQVDLMPTAMNLLGVDALEGVHFGRDLFQEGEPPVVIPGYIPYGSFIDRDTLVEMGRDGELQNAKRIRLFTHEPSDRSVESEYRHVLRELELSRFVLTHDRMVPRETRSV